jgi:hypothetical protein
VKHVAVKGAMETKCVAVQGVMRAVMPEAKEGACGRSGTASECDKSHWGVRSDMNPDRKAVGAAILQALQVSLETYSLHYFEKVSYHTSILMGQGWVNELLQIVYTPPNLACTNMSFRSL